MSNIIVAPCSKMSAESHFEDLSQHPKFNAVLGQIEWRERPRKTAIPLEAETAQQILPAKDEDQEEGEDYGAYGKLKGSKQLQGQATEEVVEG